MTRWPASERGEKGVGVRVSTRVERTVFGWYCVAHFWYSTNGPIGVAGEPHPRESDDSIRVGPFATQEIADTELRGKFREGVLGAMRDWKEKSGATLISAAFGQDGRG